jgi:hypothetical protein
MQVVALTGKDAQSIVRSCIYGNLRMLQSWLRRESDMSALYRNVAVA